MYGSEWEILPITFLLMHAAIEDKVPGKASKKSFIKKSSTASLKKTTFVDFFYKLMFSPSFTYPLTERDVGAPQMTSQPVFSNFLCSPLPSGTWRTPGLSIPKCCFPTSSFACHVFFPLSLCLARWYWPDLMNGRHDHTTAVCISLRSSGLHVVQLPAGSWQGLPRQ